MSAAGEQVSLYPPTAAEGLQIRTYSAIAWRLKMYYLTIHSMKSMHHVPKLDRKMLGYGVSWIVAITTSMIGVAAYA